MSVSYDKNQDRYFVAPQSGPYAMGYGNFTVPSTYGGSCTTLSGNPTGPMYQSTVRERMRCIYDNGVQGGSPAGKASQLTDAQTASGCRPPFLTSAINYFGTLDPFREHPYGTGYGHTGVSIGEDTPAMRDYNAMGHYVASCGSQYQPSVDFSAPENYQQPLFVLPIPGERNAKTIGSMSFPGPDNVKTCQI
jgi:hypothetical protein